MDEQNNPILVPVFCLRQVKHGRGNWLSLFRYSVAVDSVVAVLIVAAVGLLVYVCECVCVCVFCFCLFFCVESADYEYKCALA